MPDPASSDVPPSSGSAGSASTGSGSAGSAAGGNGPDSGDRRPPGQRRAGDRGAWSAATDPIGPQPAASRPASVPPAGTHPAGGRPSGGPPADSQSPGGQAGRDAPIRDLPISKTSGGRKPDRPPGANRDSGRTTGETGRVVSRPSRPQRPDSRRSGAPGGDLLTDLQRWMIRSSAKTMRREIEGQVRRTLGSGRTEPEDVWGTATTEVPPEVGESPECAWCPICRAARRMRDSGPGLGSQVSGASKGVAAYVQDAIVAFDTVLSRTAAPPVQEPPADRSPASGPADSASDEAERAQDEPGDRG
jgi:hypothetical protein